MKQNWTIRTRLIFDITIPSITILLLLSLWLLWDQIRDERSRYDEKIQSYSVFVPRLLQKSLLDMDDESARTIAQTIADDRDIDTLEVTLNKDPKIFEHRKNLGGNLTTKQIAIRVKDVLVGSVVLAYTDKNIQERIQGAGLKYGLIVLILSGTMSLLISFSAFRLTRPLYKVIAVIREIGSGEGVTELPVFAPGELSALLETVRTMQDNLKAKEETIKKVTTESFELDLQYKLESQQLELEKEAHDKSKKLRRQLEETVDRLSQAKEQLILSEKMALLGSLVAGISHEINTPVGTGVTTASFLAERTRQFAGEVSTGTLKKSSVESYLKAAQESTELILFNLGRASDLVKSFKQVSVDQSSEAPRVFNLKTYWESIFLSVWHHFKKTSHRREIECEDLWIYGYPGAISQIFTNLIMNSLIHGFSGRENGVITLKAARQGEKLNLLYSDNGKGISAKNLAHHFEPFFTTMRNTGGSGLGTYVVYELVTKTLKGTISVSSAVDQGVSYVMTIPVEFRNPDTAL